MSAFDRHIGDNDIGSGQVMPITIVYYIMCISNNKIDKFTDIIEHSNKQLFRATLRSYHCLNDCIIV